MEYGWWVIGKNKIKKKKDGERRMKFVRWNKEGEMELLGGKKKKIKEGEKENKIHLLCHYTNYLFSFTAKNQTNKHFLSISL